MALSTTLIEHAKKAVLALRERTHEEYVEIEDAPGMFLARAETAPSCPFTLIGSFTLDEEVGNGKYNIFTK